MKSRGRKALIKPNEPLRSHWQQKRRPAFPPVVLTIAGSDNSGGAGIQADLKTATTLRTYGASAITSLVAEHPGRVHRIAPVAPSMVIDQIRLVFEAFPVAAIKTGMLFSRPIIAAVARELRQLAPGVPLVVDPVMVATSGAVLLKKDAISVLKKELLPLATLVTPNRDEAALLWGQPIRNLEDLCAAGIDLSTQYGCAFLVKGGHLRSHEAVDVLCQGTTVRLYKTPMIRGVNPHGTGCTLSAAIAASLAKGLPLEKSVAAGKAFITRAVQTHFQHGKHQVLNVLPG